MATKESTTTFKVVMFPWLAHGHISPYFELAKKLRNKKFHIFFCSTAINLSSIKESFKNSSSDFSIEFVELHLPHIPELPPKYHTTKGLPHNLLSTLIDAFQMPKTKTSFSDIITSLKPDLLIYDIFQPWAAEFASFHKVPCVPFFTSGAAATSYFYHIFRYGWSQSGYYPFQEIFIRDYEKKISVKVMDTLSQFVIHSLELSHENIALIKSCKGIEDKYLDYFSSLSGKKMVPVGPLVQEPTGIEEDHLHIFKWLNKKDSSSVVLISFGSEYFPSKEEMIEIAHGLELSKANFIWVIRFPEGNSRTVAESVPEGFLERTKDTGIVVEGWIPQAKILQHQRIAAFMTHCGWGSSIETMYYGVPVIAVPMNVDQPANARLLLELGVGKEILKDENGKLKREEIAKVLIEEIIEKKTWENVKQKARELSKKLRMEEDELLDEAIVKLTMICSKNMQKLG